MSAESGNSDLSQASGGEAWRRGLGDDEVARRRQRFGPNTLPEQPPPSLAIVFLRQFLSPLIYILLVAVGISLLLGDVQDAIFIAAVLLVNGIIGTVQEYSANRAASALRRLQQVQATVVREGIRQDVDATELVPGDAVILEAGMRVPADIELREATNLLCDESLLTGESVPVRKSAEAGPEAGPRSPRRVYAGTTVTRGRGTGLVVATGTHTELGEIAAEVSKRPLLKAPLIVRMENFARMIAIAVGIAILVLVVVGLLRQLPAYELFMLALGLAVSAIPEGLPVAISVALAVAMGGWRAPASSCATWGGRGARLVHHDRDRQTGTRPSTS